MYDRVLQIPKAQTDPVGVQIHDGGAGTVEVRVTDYTNQHVATVQIGGARINHVNAYSADCYEVNVSKLSEALYTEPDETPIRLDEDVKRLLRPPYASTNLAIESHELRIGDLECKLDEDFRVTSQRLAQLEEIAREHSHETDPLKGGKSWMPGVGGLGRSNLGPPHQPKTPTREELVETISFRLACFDDEVYGEKGVTETRAAKFIHQAMRLIDELGLGEP